MQGGLAINLLNADGLSIATTAAVGGRIEIFFLVVDRGADPFKYVVMFVMTTLSRALTVTYGRAHRIDTATIKTGIFVAKNKVQTIK